ncbi:hypothetical protein GCM10028803_04880 [Larkinella knui]
MIPVTSCHIIEEVYQNASILGGPPKSPTETLDIDGIKVPIGITDHRQYEYDNQGRVSRVVFVPVPEALVKGRTDTFEYATNQVIQTITLPDGTKEKSTFKLNEFGSWDLSANTYDADGFVIRTKVAYSTGKEWFEDGVDEYTIEGGNIIKSISTRPQNGFTFTTLYEYDLSKPNVPVIYSFYARTSKNLPTKIISYQGPIGASYRSEQEYRYVFDQNGQVKRRIEISNSYTTDGTKYLPTRYVVTDYTITCQ